MGQESLISLPLHGERVSLTALEEKDLANLLPFFQDIAALAYYLPTTARPFNQHQLDRLLADWNDGQESFVFAVRWQDELIGLVNLDGLDWANSHAELGIALTSQKARGQGLAGEALELLISYCFLELGLYRVWARIIAGNLPSLQLFKRLGFIQEGALRQHVLRGGQRKDMLLFGLLRHEWAGLKIQPKAGQTHKK